MSAVEMVGLLVLVLLIGCMVIALWLRFSEPKLPKQDEYTGNEAGWVNHVPPVGPHDQAGDVRTIDRDGK